MPFKALILESTVCSNTGDASIMLAAEKTLRAAFGNDIRIDIFDKNPESSRELYPDHHIHLDLAPQLFQARLGASRLKRLKTRGMNKISWLAVWAGKNNLWPLANLLIGKKRARALKIYVNSDAVMTTGGTYLVEHYDFTNRILQFQLDQYLGKPLIFYTQSLGPYQKQSNIEALRPVMQRAPLILLRDEKSCRHLEPVLKDRSHCHVVADSVFALAEIEKIDRIINGDLKIKPDIKNIAISVREWPHFKSCSPEEGMERYKGAVAAVIEKLVAERDLNITFISTCQGLPEYRYDDSQVAADIYETLSPAAKKNVSVNSYYHDPVQIMEILRGMDMVVATRMHMMIMGLCVGVPVLPISYEFKTTELSNAMGISDILSDIETITAKEICDKADLLLNNFQEMTLLSMKGVRAQYNSAMQAVPLIQKALNVKAV